MLNKLRIRLTFIYLVAAVMLAVAVGGGTYSLISYYFRSTNDEALRIKIGLEFAARDIPLPMDLYSSVRKAGLVLTLPASSNGEELHGGIGEKNEGLQESELADIYVLPLDSEGSLNNGNYSDVLLSRLVDDAFHQALEKGHDLRTVKFDDGTSARILTYLVPGEYPVKVFQAGKYLTLQNITLNQLMKTMIILGAVITIFIGAAAWLLAGRTLKPTQQAWEKQQMFVANASHELRAPLTLIRAGVEVAIKDAKTASQKQILHDVLSDSDYMNRLIEELLLLTRMDGHVVKFELKPINLAEFLPKIIRQLNVAATNDGLKLHSKIDEIWIDADPLRLEQILLIVADNAIQNTPRGGEISIVVFAENKDVHFLISDTGPGIKDEHLPHIFDRFYSVPQRAKNQNRSSGLGLAIAKDLVEAQKGTIRIHNRRPHGTEVELIFRVSKLV